MRFCMSNGCVSKQTPRDFLIFIISDFFPQLQALKYVFYIYIKILYSKYIVY